jgi:hypothetical protein
MRNCGALYFTATQSSKRNLRRALNCIFSPSQAAAGKAIEMWGRHRAAPLAMCELQVFAVTPTSLGALTLLERSIDRFQCSPCVSDWIRYTLVELPNYLSAQWKLTFLLVCLFNNGGAAAAGARVMVQ